MEAYKGIRTHMRRINYDLVVLRNRLVELKKRANLLCSEALQHQLNFMLDSVDQRILGHNPLLDIGFGERYLDLMNKKSEVQQKVSLSGLSEVKVSVKRVVGLLDEPEPLSSPKRRKVENDTSEDIQIEKGVFKLYKTDGTIGDVAYATTFLVKNKLGDEGEKIEEMTDLSLGTQSTVVKRMLTPERLSSHETVYCFTADLYYYKVSIHFFVNSWLLCCISGTYENCFYCARDSQIWYWSEGQHIVINSYVSVIKLFSNIP
ncbi:hypothetical protein E2C01_069774 [Portunus trituberculatus]|uniref:Uncharacterized protein n=1 Tax=Portunus trituberculatus TaxID=210409 RepID=A0A5B7I388_PORTR|nr:hypothetical protein [Portunus trituberculatus]